MVKMVAAAQMTWHEACHFRIEQVRTPIEINLAFLFVDSNSNCLGILEYAFIDSCQTPLFQTANN